MSEPDDATGTPADRPTEAGNGDARPADPEPQNRPLTGEAIPERAADGRFAPGVSGNPGGRPRLPANIRTAARDAGPRAFERAVELIEDEDSGIALRACALILDRAYGKAAQPLVLDVDDDGESGISALDLARRVAFILTAAEIQLQD